MKQLNHFGAAFRTLRLVRGLTQEDFAQQSGRTYISELERGIKQPTLQKIDELAAPLAVHSLTLLFLAYLNQIDMASSEDLISQISNELHQIIESHQSANSFGRVAIDGDEVTRRDEG
jgi:transcriptional regulator with XRE-family HTH domain